MGNPSLPRSFYPPTEEHQLFVCFGELAKDPDRKVSLTSNTYIRRAGWVFGGPGGVTLILLMVYTTHLW
jgi:hypothetical protein